MISYLIANRNKGAIMPCALTTLAGQRSPATLWDSTSWDREVARNRPKHFNRRRPR